MKQIKTEAIILRRTNYGEADRILKLLTPHDGVVSAIAKSVRKTKSKLAGGLELFATCDVTILEGRGELGIVTSARLRQFYGHILQDYDRMQFAYEAIKRVSTAVATVAEPEFYELLAHIYHSLDNLQIDWRLSEVWFRLRLAQLLGRGLNLRYDVSGAKLDAEKLYGFDVGEMGFIESATGRFRAADIKFLRLAAVKSPEVLAHIGGLDEVIENCLWLSRVASE
ncbi:MAG TPA: DNA repair protein RecO [Candidatus Saccharimonadales bacterium]|jgi:DNA repair protein RecO (recombination protein O)|nr:DNA repair protein RecO [Candidatus Saccharimonadales bacterium]